MKSFGKGLFKNIVEFGKQGILKSDVSKVGSVHPPFKPSLFSYVNSCAEIKMYDSLCYLGRNDLIKRYHKLSHDTQTVSNKKNSLDKGQKNKISTLLTQDNMYQYIVKDL